MWRGYFSAAWQRGNIKIRIPQSINIRIYFKRYMSLYVKIRIYMYELYGTCQGTLSESII